MSEALRLADILEKMPLGECDEQAAAELRRLHAENEALREANNSLATASILPDDKMIVSRADYAELVEALRDIADPIAAWRRDLEDGYTLNGAMCVQMSGDPETYKRMARAALAKVEASK